MNFNQATFAKSTRRERIAVCHAFAAEAQNLAEAGGQARDAYVGFGNRWFALAAEFEKLDGGVNEAS